MGVKNGPIAFGAVAKLLHWTMAVLLIGMLALGVYMHELPLSPYKFELYALHKSFGIVALGLALLRLGWRAVDPPPAALPSTPRGHARLAKAAHWALYGCMLGIPITGWCMAAARGAAVDLFNTGVLMPNPVSSDNDVRIVFGTLHDILGKLLMALLAVHLGAALKHHFVDKDVTLLRMTPFAKGDRTPAP